MNQTYNSFQIECTEGFDGLYISANKQQFEPYDFHLHGSTGNQNENENHNQTLSLFACGKFLTLSLSMSLCGWVAHWAPGSHCLSFTISYSHCPESTRPVPYTQIKWDLIHTAAPLVISDGKIFGFFANALCVYVCLFFRCASIYRIPAYSLTLVHFTIGGLPQEFILEAYTMGQKQNPIILKSK